MELVFWEDAVAAGIQRRSMGEKRKTEEESRYNTVQRESENSGRLICGFISHIFL